MVPGGIELRGQAAVLDALVASSLRSRRGKNLVLESWSNFTASARSHDGRLLARLTVGKMVYCTRLPIATSFSPFIFFTHYSMKDLQNSFKHPCVRREIKLIQPYNSCVEWKWQKASLLKYKFHMWNINKLRYIIVCLNSSVSKLHVRHVVSALRRGSRRLRIQRFPNNRSTRRSAVLRGQGAGDRGGGNVKGHRRRRCRLSGKRADPVGQGRIGARS